MAIGEAISSPAAERPNFGRITVEYLQHWCGICDRFNEWQHKQIFGRNPTPQEQEDHRQELKWLLRLTKLMHYTVTDPEFPDRSVVDLLEAKIWQLEQAWKVLYRRPPQPEIDAAENLLREVFPDAPGA